MILDVYLGCLRIREVRGEIKGKERAGGQVRLLDELQGCLRRRRTAGEGGMFVEEEAGIMRGNRE